MPDASATSVCSSSEYEVLIRKLFSRLSHELRAPLTSLTGALSLLSAAELTPDESAEFMALATTSAIRMSKTLEQELDVQRILAGNEAASTSNETQFEVSLSEADEFPSSLRKECTKVLMVEDDRVYGHLVKCLLEQSNHGTFQLLQVGSLNDCFEQLSWHPPDVILLDLNLPDGNGLSALAKIRNVCSRVPIIILTGSNDQQAGVHAVASGASDYLVKHRLGNESLARAIVYAVERNRFEQSTLRMSAIRDFSSALAHDLKVPMIGMRNVLAAFAEGQFGELPLEMAQIIGTLQQSNLEQIKWVEKLLEVYRYEGLADSIQFGEVDLTELLRQSIAHAQQNAAGMSIEAVVPTSLPPVKGNSDALMRLFDNLLDNALKFSDRKQPVTIQVAIRGDTVETRIRNSGPPMPEQVKRGVDQFWQGVPGKAYVAQTGLGLYLCHRITALHSGTIVYDGDDKDGTTIAVRLPALT